MFEIPAALLSWFYSWTNSYMAAIALIAAVVMAITTPLTLKSTKGMLEMQRLAPEMRRLQNEYRDDRVKLNEEMMKLYQQHKVNPMASCLPILAQMPVFIIMFNVVRGLTYEPTGKALPIGQAVVRQISNGPAPSELGFLPRYLSTDSALFQSLQGQTEMTSLGIDLSLSPFEAISEGLGKGWIYALLVVGLGSLYFLQQRMVAARASISPTMSPTQQKLLQYLPVVFAVFQLFFLAALVVFYIFQTVLRIGQQAYITRKFYSGEESLGRQAQRASEAAREEAKKQKSDGGGKQSLSDRIAEVRDGGGSESAKKSTTGKPSAKGTSSTKSKPPATGKQPAKSTSKGAAKSGGKGGGSGAGKGGGAQESAAGRQTNKRVTPPKNRPTPSSGGPKSRPTSGARPKSSGSKSTGERRPDRPRSRRKR